MHQITELLQHGRLYFDGGTGTLLQARGLQPGELPETWNLAHPEEILDLHRAYFASGCNIVKTNTFGAYGHKFEYADAVIRAGVMLARQAAEEYGGRKEKRFVAYDMGPLGRMLSPLGDLAFEDAVSLFAAGVRTAADAGADLILIETMSDAYEAKAAVLAAKESCGLPIFVTCAYDESGKLMTGTSPEAMVALLEGLRVDALGINCSLGPRQMLPVVEKLLRCSSLPVIVNPNAGLPKSVHGKTLYDVDAAAFSEVMVTVAEMGASVLGGCCGTTPEYIKQTIEKTKALPYAPPTRKAETVVSSYGKIVRIGQGPVLVGERINPTGKPRMKEALRQGDFDHLVREGLSEEEKGAHILDVNVGLPEIDEEKMLTQAVKSLQAVTALPLQIDTANPAAMAAALRVYNGKPLINSVSGKEESLSAILPLAAKYGGVLIALTIGEEGIPETAEGRLAVAEKIICRAAEYGIDKKDIVVDPLAMTISADTKSARVTLDAIRLIRARLGVSVSLGVSNISFGLPARDTVNAAFFTMALAAGLDLAIMNPHSLEMMKSYRAFLALDGQDENCGEYIRFAGELPALAPVGTFTSGTASTGEHQNKDELHPLCHDIVKGLKESARTHTKALLQTETPLDIINHYIVPSLDIVGQGFEAKTVFLPQLLMSAEAAKEAFEAVREAMPPQEAADGEGHRIVLATVKGDIHDIGKNIVRVLLQNYGFSVIDLGKDVPPEAVLEAVLQKNVRLVGLSALMTTTVPAMADTIALLKQSAPGVKIVVGGAVMTAEYAAMIGADYYSKDAMQTVRYAEKFFEETL